MKQGMVPSKRNGGRLKYAELKRYLRRKGAKLYLQGANHEIWELNGKFTEISRHKSQEVKKGTLNGILKDLGLK